MKKEFTGMLDKNGKRIHVGDTLKVGIRRGDERGWSIEMVIKKPFIQRIREKIKGREFWSDYQLADPLHGERMDMVLDQELREIKVYEER